ncbi:MAG: CpaD family pilus assembly protein [Parvularculaceae bacterium]|jgi:pilus assembly protein CpaD|nr:CpaD family pilus assembly protein [Parvularculaceae bacterium]
MKTAKLRFLISAAAAALLAGCAGAWNGPEAALTIAEEHPITVDSQVVTMTVGVDGAVTDLDRSRLAAFAQAYLENGHGPVSISAPAATKRYDAAAEVRQALNDAGVSWADMSSAGYIPAEGSKQEIVLSYTRYVATPSACGVWQGVKARDYANRRSPNFGCATQNNLAAMVADPRDLMQPADEAPADATARIRGVKAYREGQKTSSETDSEIKQQVSSQ